MNNDLDGSPLLILSLTEAICLKNIFIGLDDPDLEEIVLYTKILDFLEESHENN